jgi:hypothetical protein
MATYTIHVKGDPAEAGLAERTVLVRDGFSFAALFFGPAWLLWHRLWLGLLIWLAAELAILLLGFFVLPGSRGVFLLGTLVSLALGFEGSQLRRRALGRRGYAFIDIATAPRQEAAERIFFERCISSPVTPVRSLSVPTVRTDPPMVGLFPSVSGRSP